MKTKVEIVIVIPIASTRDLDLVKETIKDIDTYYNKSHHIILVDDTENYQFKNFNGKNYTTIWSGKQALKEKGKFHNKPLSKVEDTIFFVVAVGLMYAFYNFKFEFLQYLDSDAVVINYGLDDWLYSMQQKYDFDLLGPLDDEADTYESYVNEDKYCEILPCLSKENQGKIIYLVEQKAYRFPVVFYAIHFYSYRAVEKLVQLNEKYAILRSQILNRRCNRMTAEPHLTTLIKLLGLNIVFYGGMNQAMRSPRFGKSGFALPPILSSFYMTGTRDKTLQEIRHNFKVVHRLEGLCGLQEEECRKQLSLLRQGITPTNSFTVKTPLFPKGKEVVIDPVSEGIYRPFWSVMIPTYNCADYLVDTLKSVLEQDPGSEEMQIEVVDDCSMEDDIETLVKEIGKGRISFFRQPHNIGATANFNTCIQRAKGQWVHILHGDDIVLPGFYAHLRESVEREPNVRAGFCRYIYIDQNGNWQYLSILERETSGILSECLERIAVVNRIMPPAIVVRRSVYEELGGFHPELIYAADWEMWKRIAVNYQVWYETQPLACYRQHLSPNTFELIQSGANIADNRRAIEISESYLPKFMAKELSIKSREIQALYALDTTYSMLEMGNINGAFAQIQEALKCSKSAKVIKSLTSRLTSNESEPLLSLVASLLSSNEPEQFLASSSDINELHSKLELDLRDINLIIFPDWKQSHESLYQDLSSVIKSIITHAQSNRMSLLVDNSNLSDEDAKLIISDVLVNLLQDEQINVTENEPGLSLVGSLEPLQWKLLFQRIHARIVLNNESLLAVRKSGVENIPNISLKELKTNLNDNLIMLLSSEKTSKSLQQM